MRVRGGGVLVSRRINKVLSIFKKGKWFLPEDELKSSLHILCNMNYFLTQTKGRLYVCNCQTTAQPSGCKGSLIVILFFFFLLPNERQMWRLNSVVITSEKTSYRGSHASSPYKEIKETRQNFWVLKHLFPWKS